MSGCSKSAHRARWAHLAGLLRSGAHLCCMWRRCARACQMHGSALLLGQLVGPRMRCGQKDVWTSDWPEGPSMPMCMAKILFRNRVLWNFTF